MKIGGDKRRLLPELIVSVQASVNVGYSPGT
jgi:hypothetical protein